MEWGGGCGVGNSASTSLVRERWACVAQKTESWHWGLGLCGWVGGSATWSHRGGTDSLSWWKFRSWQFSSSYEGFEALLLVRLRVGFQHELEVIGKKSMCVCSFIHVWLHTHWDNVQLKWANHSMACLRSTSLWFPICVKQKLLSTTFSVLWVGWRCVATYQICCHSVTTLLSCGSADATTLAVYFYQLTGCFPWLNMLSWAQQWPHTSWYSEEWSSFRQPFPFYMFWWISSVTSDPGKV